METKVFIGNIQHQDQHRRKHDQDLRPSERMSLLMKFREQVLADISHQPVTPAADSPEGFRRSAA